MTNNSVRQDQLRGVSRGGADFLAGLFPVGPERIDFQCPLGDS